MKKTHNPLIYSFLILSLFLAACTQSDKSQLKLSIPQQNNQSILGGATVPNTQNVGKYVVGLFAPRFGSCSGVIISPHLILTAAHCIPQNPQSLTVVFSTNLMSATQNSMRSVISAVTTSLWKTNSSQLKNKGDLAVIRFSGALPAGYQPAYLLTNSYYLVDRGMTLLAGFGLSEGSKQSSSAGILRETFTTITQINFSQTEIMISQLNGKGTCSGDSGGPAFILVNGNYYLWGITSQGDGDCRDYGIYTNIVPYLAWIKKVASLWNF